MKKNIQKNHNSPKALSRGLFPLLLSILYFLPLQTAFGANTTIGVNPSNASYKLGTSETISIVIDGHGDSFNAAQATVSISSKMLITGVTLGDCNFSFVKIPTITNLSFTGVILGSSSQKCTVYTVTVLPTVAGSGRIDFSNVSIKSSSKAQEILNSVQNGNYSIASLANGIISITVTPTPSIQVPGTSLTTTSTTSGNYIVLLQAVDSNKVPLKGVTISLDPSSTTKVLPANKTLFQSKTNQSGVVKFTNVSSGIHTAIITNGDQQLAKTILNVAGPEHTIVLGIEAQNMKKTVKPFSWMFMAGLIIFMFCLFFILIRFTLVKHLVKRKMATNEKE